MDLARDLIRLAGRDPSSQPIETIGLRPGEKLHEELFYDIESVEPTESVNVRRAPAGLVIGLAIGAVWRCASDRP